jgi:RNA polymerase sigma-70 factor, ECF subfamily
MGTVVRGIPPLHGSLDRRAGAVAHGRDAAAERLVRRVRDGDERALDRLIDWFWEPVLACSYGVVGSLDAAEDVAQEVFVRVWSRRRAWTPSGGVAAYLMRIARNIALNQKRSVDSRSRREGRFAVEEARGALTPEDVLQRRELRYRVVGALRSLPPRRRRIFVHARLHGWSYGRIAKAMCISQQTVANQLSRATVHLRQVLREDRAWMDPMGNGATGAT